MHRQVDKGVGAGLLCGLAFTAGVVYLFEQGIPQRWLTAPQVPSSSDPNKTPAHPDHLQLASPAAAVPPGPVDLPLPSLPTTAPAAPPDGAAGTPDAAAAATIVSDLHNEVDKEGAPAESWPRWALRTPPADASLPLPAGARVLSLDVDPRGRRAALVLETARGERAVHLWNFESELPKLTLRPPGASPPTPPSPSSPNNAPSTNPSEVAWSRFGSGLFVLTSDGTGARIDLYPTPTGRPDAPPPRVVYRSKGRLSSLIASGTRYDDAERIFFAREYAAGQWQIMSVRADATLLYEVTSASGKLGPLTDNKLRKPDSDGVSLLPVVLRARSARPVSIHPASGRLLLTDETGALRSLPYAYASNWDNATQKVDVPPGTVVRDTPNGGYVLRWTTGKPGVTLVATDAAIPSPPPVEQTPRGERDRAPAPPPLPVVPVAADRRFVLPPVSAPTGRTLIGVVAEADHQRLLVSAVPERLAYVRYLSNVGTGYRGGPNPTTPQHIRSALHQRGIFFTNTDAEQLFQVYEGLEYTECGEAPKVPIFASVDGFLEILAAGFQATFMATEQLVGIPRLERFLTELGRAARRKPGLSRVEQLAATSLALLKGDYSSAEGKRVLAEKPATSTLHTVGQTGPIDFRAFHPRGPYTATDRLKHYFRAFHYIGELQLTDDERRLLDTDGPLQKTWEAWVATQSALLFGTRLPLLLDPDRAPPSYVRSDCIPAAIKTRPRLFPLAFGPDSEIWHSVVAHSGVPDDCQVPGRALPSGLDLLTALGSSEAQAIQSDEYARIPALQQAHERLRRRFAPALPSDRVSDSWLRLVQLLATDRTVPEGVDPQLWRRRLLQTALASWTNYRHTTVLLNENVSAECGGDWRGFEQLTSEPLRGAVDPVVESWEQLARTLGQLTAHTRKMLPDQTDLARILDEARAQALSFARMAALQRRGLPLSNDDYQAIQRFSGAIEHPYLKIKTLLSGVEESGLQKPEPMTKIVDVASAGSAVFHLAVGTPLQVTLLLGDRGILVPVSGGVYSYHEVVAKQYLDDDAWRKRSDPPLPWSPLALQNSPAAPPRPTPPAAATPAP